MNPFTFIKDARLAYLEYLDAGGYEIVVTQRPHEPSGELSVYDSDLGMCPKKAALQKIGATPTHPNLAALSFADLHRMRSGVLVEHDWIASLRHAHPERWLVRDGVRLHGPTHGKVDAWLVFPPACEQPQIGDERYAEVLVEFKRTDAGLKDWYVFQLCSYLYKAGARALGKIILDHRHMVEEYTLKPIVEGLRLVGWQVLSEKGEPEAACQVSDLLAEIEAHRWWLNELTQYSVGALLPAGIQSPLDSWQCHQDWKKREGRARFRCPYAGYCFGILAGEFEVHNEKEGRKIVARVVVADDGREFRHQEMSSDE